MTDILAPQPDADSAPFWAAVREHRLTVQRCDECAAYRFPARPICPRCHSWRFTWSEVSGRGTVLSWVVTHHVTHPAFARQVPYPVLFVELAEQPGLTMYGNLRPPDVPITSGLPVRAVFEDLTDAVTLVQWAPE
jgi:uncharacterized OB-fold protein